MSQLTETGEKGRDEGYKYQVDVRVYVEVGLTSLHLRPFLGSSFAQVLTD